METSVEKNMDLNLYLQYSSNPLFELLRQGEKTKNVVDVAKKLKTQDSEDFDKANFLLCIKCKFPIAQESDRIQINEKHQHVFANPNGHIYQIGCFARAPGCFVFGDETSYFTWFPGYAWRIALCGKCGTLLGWAFQLKENHFFGLILDKIKNYNNAVKREM